MVRSWGNRIKREVEERGVVMCRGEEVSDGMLQGWYREAERDEKI